MQGFGHQLVGVLIQTLRFFLEPVDGGLRDLLETDQIGIDAEDLLGGVRLLKRIHHLNQAEDITHAILVGRAGRRPFSATTQ